MTPSNQPNSQKPIPPKKQGGFQFQPWPLQDALVNFAAIAMLFAIGSFLPKDMLPFSALMAGSMAGITMSYLSFCGYSFWTATFRMKIKLACIFFGVLMVTGSLVKLILGPNA